MLDIFDWLYKNIWVHKNSGFVLFGLGLLTAYVSKLFKDNNEKKNYRKSLNLIIKDFSQGCKNQSYSISKSLETANLLKGNDFMITSLSISSLSYLSQIDISAFIRSYIKSCWSCKKRKMSIAVSIFFEIISNVKSRNEDSKSSMKLFFNSYSSAEKEYYHNMGGLRLIYDKAFVVYKIPENVLIPPGTLINDYLIIWIKWVKNGQNATIAESYNQLVKPIYELISLYRTDPLILEIIELESGCHKAFITIEKIDNLLRNKFKKHASYLKRASTILNIVLKIFGYKENKVKRYFWRRLHF